MKRDRSLGCSVDYVVTANERTAERSRPALRGSRRAWTFDEFSVTLPQAYLARDDSGAMNVARFDVQATEPAASGEAAGEQLPRLFIFDFAITGGGELP